MSVLLAAVTATWAISTTTVAATYMGCLVSKRVRLAVFG